MRDVRERTCRYRCAEPRSVASNGVTSVGLSGLTQNSVLRHWTVVRRQA